MKFLRFIACLVGALSLFASPASAQIRDGGIDPWNLGKGDWIYVMSSATNKLGGNVLSVTNEVSLFRFYKQMGIRYIIVKAATSDSLYNGTYNKPQFTTNLCNIAHAEGLLIFGYNRSYGANITAEIGISDYVFNCGADGFVWDAESEWEDDQPWIGTNGPAKAWQLCSTVRSNWPTKFLAHSPFPIISYHTSFPYKEFGYWCDAVLPQIYPHNWTGVFSRPSGGIDWTDANWRSWQASLVGSSSVIDGQTIYWTNAIKPLVPVNHVYGPNPPNTGVAHINDDFVTEFVDYLAADPNTVTPGGYKGANFWRADLHGSKQWTNIGRATIGSFSNVVNNIVMDDAAGVQTGTWDAVRVFSNGRYYGATGSDTNSFGTNYLVRTQGSGNAYVEFRPRVVTAGQYDVYQWHVYRADASTGVPFVINHSGGSTTVSANQTTNAGRWSFLGRFDFAVGTNGTVRVMDNVNGGAGSVAIADGIKLMFVYPTSVPATPNGVNATPVSNSQINIGWSNNATNESGYTVLRGTSNGGPYVEVGQLPVNTTAFSDTGLTPNTTYYYVVRSVNYLGMSPNSAQATATTMGAPSAPVITSHPQPHSAFAGDDAALLVAASGSQPLFYQWRRDGSDIANATTATLTLNNVPADLAGVYSVLVSNSLGVVVSSNATLTVIPAYKSGGWDVLWKLGGGSRTNLNSSNHLERSLAYNAIGNRLLFLSRASGTKVYALDGDTGAQLYEMNIDPGIVTGGTYPLLMLGVAEDGVVYGGNLTTSGATTPFRLYRWSNDNSNTPPVLVYSGDPSPGNSQRWGDTLDVRGYGKYTQVIIGSRSGQNVAVLTTTNGTNFSATSVTVADAAPVNFGLGIAFGAGDTFWGKATNLPLRQVSFNLAAGTGATIRSYTNNFPAMIAPIGVNPRLNLLAGISVQTPDSLHLYDLTHVRGAPVLIGTTNFATGNANTFFVGSVDFGNDRVYALDANNGIVALQLTTSLPRPMTTVTPVGNVPADLLISGQPSAAYAIDRSSNLVDWAQVANVVNTNGAFHFIDSAPHPANNFYRVRD